MPSLSLPGRASIFTLVAGSAVGLSAGIAVAAARDYPPKYYLPGLAALLFGFLLVAAGRYAERVCLWAFLLATPLPMHVFLVELRPMHGGGALGIYLQPPDLCLALLYTFWIASRLGDSPREYRSWRMVLLFLPFLCWGGLSMLYADASFWALCEWLRWVKVGLVLLYATRRLNKSDIEACLWVLALSATLQAGVGCLQAGFKSNLGLEKLGLFGSGARYDATQEILGGVALFRGSGLTSHPNFLASYLLLLLPLLLTRSIIATGKAKVLWYGALAIATGGLFSTMSRTAWAAFLGVGALVLVAAIVYRLLTLRRAFQLSMALLTAVLGLVLYFLPTIRGRFQADFSESWKLRKDLAATALDIAADHPVAGVGLNNYTVIYPQYNPGYAAELMENDDMITVVHNVFLLVLAETGAIGLSGFLLFYGGIFVFGLHGLRTRGLRQRAAVVGLLAGILAAMLLDLTEFSLWTELCMYTVAFSAGLVDSLNPSRRGQRFVALEPPILTAGRSYPQGVA
jgi:O-antigen ligase